MIFRRTLDFAAALMGAMSLLVTARAQAQTKLSPKWEELTAADFRRGIEQSKGTCVLPFGIWKNTGRICRWGRTC
jgi:hypothetical protein